MKKHLLSFLSGCLTALLLVALGTSALAVSGQVIFNFANVALDGETKITAGTTITAANGQQVPSSILYTDEAGGKTNYLPIRAISELLGVEVDYDSATKTVLLVDQDAQTAVRGAYWQRVVDGTSVTYESEENAASYTAPPTWYPTWLPEGWSLEEAEGRSSRADYRFAGGEGRVTFWCAYPDGGSFGFSVSEEETVQNCSQVSVQGYPADLYEEEEKTYLIWEGKDGILFWFSGTDISVEHLTKMAESVQPVTGQLPEYELSWMPEGYTKYERNISGSAVQETWLGPDISLTLLYASNPVELPDGMPEPVKVNGVDAQYWEAEEPYKSGSGSMTVSGEKIEGTQTEIGGVTISVGTIIGPTSAHANTLAWKDPETGLYFRIHGTVDKETMIHIAEQVK